MTLADPAQERLVEAIHVELRALYPAIPGCIVFENEPSGDFGIAHFLGLDLRTPRDDDFKITFDPGITSRYVIAHELGHALSMNASLKRGGDAFTNGLYDEFWIARGFDIAPLSPGSPMDAQLRAIAAERVKVNSGYRMWPEENFADAFGAVNSYGQGTLITETYAAALDEPRLRAFYASLEGEFEVTDEDIQKIARAVANYVLPEVVGAVKAGFNTTIPTLLNRLAAGDKDVNTAVVDAQSPT